MKKKILLIAILFSSLYSYSQTDSTLININNLRVEDVAKVNIPNIDYFFQTVDNNPQVKFYQERQKAEEYALKSIKRTWLSFIRVNANAQYGFTDDLTMFTETSTPVISKYFGKTQFYYGGGASLAIPLTEFFDKRNKVRSQKARIESMKYETDVWRDDIRIKIIDSYTAAQESLNLLKARAEALVISNAQYQVTQTDFIAGRIDAMTLSRQKNIQTQTLAEYEKARSALMNALLKLELATRIKILK